MCEGVVFGTKYALHIVEVSSNKEVTEMIRMINYQVTASAVHHIETEDPEYCYRTVRGGGTG